MSRAPGASVGGAGERHASALRDVVVLAGTANPGLAEAIARELELALGGCRIERFPDGEMHVEVDAAAVEGRRVFIVEPTSKVASDHLLELLLLADACRRAGAVWVTAVMPYFGYARQDKRTRPGEALGARVVAEVLGAARFERIVAVDLHSDVVEASLSTPVEHLTAVPPLAEAVERQAPRAGVVVAPDLGAVRLARAYSRLLLLPMAVVHKVRTSGTEVSVERVAGEVGGLRPIIVDDMIATGGTIVAAAHALFDAGSKREVVVAATHAVLAPGALDRLLAAGLDRLFVTDTIALAPAHPSVTVVSAAPLLASCIRRITARRST